MGFRGGKTARSMAAPPDENMPSPEERAARSVRPIFDSRQWQYQEETSYYLNVQTGEVLSYVDFDFEAALSENTDIFHPDDEDE